MKILVTGGCGFVGSHIVDVLIRKGHTVSVVDNLSTGKKEYLNQKAKLYVADITTNLDTLFAQIQPDIVIHTAAQVMLRKSIEEPIFDAMTNIIGTINVLEACRKAHVQRVIYTSTGGARYGNPTYLPVDEKHPLEPAAPYGISKHTAEHYLKVYKELYGLDYLIFCFGNVYGPRDDPRSKRVTALFAECMIKGQQPTIFGDGNQTRDFIYVLDIAEFIVASLDKHPAHSLFNLANGEQISVNAIFEELATIAGFTQNALHIPAVKGEVRDICLDTTLAQRELGWKPATSFSEGLRATYAYLKNRK